MDTETAPKWNDFSSWLLAEAQKWDSDDEVFIIHIIMSQQSD